MTTTAPGFKSALRKQAANITGSLIIIPSMFIGVFYFLGWMEETYASDADVQVIQQQQQDQSFKFDTWVYEEKEEKLEEQVEQTGDSIFDLKRKITNRGTPSEDDARQLDRLERRLERYENRLDNLGPPPSRSAPTE